MTVRESGGQALSDDHAFTDDFHSAGGKARSTGHTLSLSESLVSTVRGKSVAVHRVPDSAK